MSTIAHSDVSFANRAPIAAEDEPLWGSFEPAVVCAAKNKGSACFSSTSATSNGAAGEAVSSARMPFSRVVAVVTDVPWNRDATKRREEHGQFSRDVGWIFANLFVRKTRAFLGASETKEKSRGEVFSR
jgi:hypothetical protein